MSKVFGRVIKFFEFFGGRDGPCRVPSTADTGCCVLEFARSTTVKYTARAARLMCLLGSG